jgi:hypothetical protein
MCEQDHTQELIERIEEQMIERFNKCYPDGMLNKKMSLTRFELVSLTAEWVGYWISEKPIIKSINDKNYIVLAMKDKLCMIRIHKILEQAAMWNIREDVVKLIKI